MQGGDAHLVEVATDTQALGTTASTSMGAASDAASAAIRTWAHLAEHGRARQEEQRARELMENASLRAGAGTAAPETGTSTFAHGANVPLRTWAHLAARAEAIREERARELVNESLPSAA